MANMTEIKALQELRETRAEEFNMFVSDPGIQAVLRKLISFLMDKESSKITIHICDARGDTSFTDGQQITLGMLDNFFAPNYGPADWAIVFKALLAHEVQHINSSNFKDMELLANAYAGHMYHKGIPKSLTTQIAKTYLNIMEDGRIENIIVHKLPGFKLPLLLVNNEIRRLSGPDKTAKDSSQEFIDFQNESLSYCLTGRHAPNMQVYKGHRLEKEFHKVKHYFDEAVDARTSSACADVCKNFLWDTADYFAELLSSSISQSKIMQRLGNHSDEYTTNGEKEFNPGNPEGGKTQGSSTARIGEPPDGKDGASASLQGGSEEKPARQNEENSDGNNGNPRKGQNSLRRPPCKDDLLDRSKGWTDDFSEENPGADYEEPVSPQELAMMRRGIHDELSNTKEDKKNDSLVADRFLDDVKEKYAKESVRKFRETFPVISDAPPPSEIAVTARRLEKSFEKILRHKCSEQRNLRHGVLDTRNLYRVGMRDPHIFMRRGEPLKADMAVYFLMDNSGSMGSCGAVMHTEDGKMTFSKSNLSRTAACIIEAALMKFAAIKISLFDVQCGAICHKTIKKFDEKTHGGKAYNSINTVHIGGGNKDGYSIRVATKELLARRESKKVLLILSDGLPSDYNGGERAGMQDVREAVKEAKRKGIIVIPIMFGDAKFRNQSKRDFSFMYETYISCDPICIAEEFQKLFISLIKKA